MMALHETCSYSNSKFFRPTAHVPQRLLGLTAWKKNHQLCDRAELQGFSIDWWKKKHNTHHAAPNQLSEESTQAVDPDIDTLPYLAWSAEMLHEVSPIMRPIIAYQQYYFFPLLMLARLIWAEQSIEHVTKQAQVN